MHARTNKDRQRGEKLVNRVCFVLKIDLRRCALTLGMSCMFIAPASSVHHVTDHAEPSESNQILPEENSFVRKVSKSADVLLHERQLGLRVCGHF